jgi:hypothetical protein
MKHMNAFAEKMIMTLRIPLVAAKILLVAMPRRNQWKKNSVGRDESSQG